MAVIEHPDMPKSTMERSARVRNIRLACPSKSRGAGLGHAAAYCSVADTLHPGNYHFFFKDGYRSGWFHRGFNFKGDSRTFFRDTF